MPFRLAARWRLGVAVALLAWLVSAPVGATAAAAAPPPFTLEERAVAIASPAMVYLETRYEGMVRDKATGAAVSAAPITVPLRCGGFVVSADSLVATSTHCVQPSAEQLRWPAYYTAAYRAIGEKKIAADQLDTYVKQLSETAVYTGVAEGSAPTSKLYAQLTSGTAALTALPAAPAQVVATHVVSNGDVALVKVERSRLPMVEIDEAGMAIDSEVIQVGFATGDSNPDAATYTIRSKPAKVVGRHGAKSPTAYKLDGEIGPYAHGGMVIDSAGRVVGVLNGDPTAKDKSNVVASHPSLIKSLLDGQNAGNKLAPLDISYRQGLDAYYAGRYREAITLLNTVVEAVPDHAMASAVRKRALDRLAIEGEPDAGMAPWLVVLLSMLGGALVIAAIAIPWILSQRAKARRAAEIYQYAGLYPVSGAPISAMPVSGNPVSGMPFGSQPYPGQPSVWPGPQPPAPLAEGASPWAPQEAQEDQAVGYDRSSSDQPGQPKGETE